MKILFSYFPIMFVYLFESMFIALFIMTIWNFSLFDLFKYDVSYIQWVGIIWIYKILNFDVYKIQMNSNDINDNKGQII